MCPGFITMPSRLAVVYNRFALSTRPRACLQHLDPPFLAVSKIPKGSGGPFSVYHSIKEILLYVFLQIIHNTAMGTVICGELSKISEHILTHVITPAQYPELTMVRENQFPQGQKWSAGAIWRWKPLSSINASRKHREKPCSKHLCP